MNSEVVSIIALPNSSICTELNGFEYSNLTQIILLIIFFYKPLNNFKYYPAQTITDADYADDIALLTNVPTETETLLHSLERAATGIHRVNAHKTEYMCFNQRGDISTRNGSSLKLVDKFTYLGNSVSSTEIDFNTQLAKAWTPVDRLSVRPNR